MVSEVQRLTAENQVLRAPQPTSLDQVVQSLGQAAQALTTVASSGAGSRQSLIDVKGFGKTSIFKNEADKFTEWSRNTAGFRVAAYGVAFRPVLEWTEDQD